ncbi:MAG: hypothetical protein EOS02_09875 [Mesorhizobium sp.]|nr:MAG: hypothetical protein EOS02_09875 [Mesorhizobium sp.]
MRLVKQLHRHLPDQGIYGDCARTVIACLLDLDPEDVPHAHRELAAGEQQEMHDAFLLDRGILRISIPVQIAEIEKALEWGAYYAKGMPYVLAGTSRTGVNHVVIAHGREIIWDPSLTDAGIIGPCDDGLYWFELLVRPL